MLTRHHGAPRIGSLSRCLAVWTAASMLTAALLRALAADLQAAGTLLTQAGRAGVPFDALVVPGCAAVLSACAGWGWVVTTALVIEALTGRHRLRRGCPAALRRLVLSACGVALVAGASPAAANTEAAGGDGAVAASHGPAVEDRSVLAGLPVPDRTAGPPQTLGAVPVLETHVVREVRVRAGDSLWSLAAADLAPGAPAAAVVRHWRLVWLITRAAMGADPDVIQPGTDLRLPPREDA